MKYPQLVSTRAVNAISDWLVTRLEQLGVEAPQIYARFLLSLLQSSVQINDPIEYSNLETFIASRKGNNRRLHQLLGDTETLKKLTAVQCLQGIVSPDQEISTIESLVEELCAKLKEFEQQNAGTSEDATLLLTSEQEPQQAEELSKEQSGQKEPGSNLNTRVIAKHRIRGGKLDTIEGAEQAQGLNTIEKKLAGSVASGGGLEKADTETDPKKRYFSAFPALSKGMDEESFRALRKNAKSLTWPVERKQSAQSAAQIAQNSSDSSNSSIYQTAGEQKSKTEDKSCGSEVGGAAAKSTTKVRRRSRRRRNQALKTKSLEQKPNSKSKTTTKGAYFVDSEETSAVAAAEAAAVKADTVANSAHKGKRKERYSTPANWDTDFEGCWEMGRDLIQEFIKKQNNRNERNRSTSESAAYVKKCVSGGCLQNIKQEVKQKQEMTPLAIDLEYYYGNAAKADQTEVASATEEEDYTLAELTLNVGGTEQRRLYERDTVIDKKSAEQETEHDFEQFKAKFNSSVEALWKDAEPVQPIAEKSEVSHAKLKSFWSHYFQEQTLVAETDVKPIKETPIGSMSLTTQAAELVANTSDYYSMPSTWDEVDKAVPRKTVFPVSSSLYSGSYGRNTESTTPVGVFLNTNSIWSDQPKTTAAANNEDNFFYKVWNANQTLTQLDNNADNKVREKPAAHLSKTYLKTGDGYPPFSVSKWSEGINAGPTVSNSNSNSYTLQGNNFGFVEGPDSSTTDSASASTTSCSSSMYPWPQHTWQAAGVVTQHAPNTVMSLTDMYARDAADNSNTASTATSSLNSPAVDGAVASTPKVTLANHAFNGNSAFAEYSRIKAVVKKNHAYAPAVMRKTFHNNMDLMCNSNENLLTSELTHFQPIRTYRDGHVFNICSAWDTVHYKRSADGFLCLGADKYLEYTRNDNYAAEDDATLAVRSGNASTAPLYASSNCDAATSMRQRKNVDVDKKPFVLKFRVIDNCEVGCQTEDPAVIAAAAAADASTKARLNALKMTDQHPLAALFAGGARTGMNARALPKTGIACSDALESLNKAIATAAKTRTQRRTPQTATINATYANNNNNNNNNKYNNNNNNNNNFLYQNFNSVYNSNNNNNQIKRNDLLLMTVDQIEVDWLPATKVAQHVAAGVKNEMYKAKSAADLWPVYHVQRASDTNVEKDQIAAVEYTAVQKNMNTNMNDVVQNKQVDVENVDVAAAYCDEVDYCLSGKKSPWTMRAIGKKCQQNEQSKRKRLKNNNNNNNNNTNNKNNNNNNNNNIISNNVSVDDEDDDNDADDEHTLWGMCAACHTENKALSLPANRLLRDELNQEADEIMNELKNMQDLYIGRDATDDDGDEYADEKEIENEFDVKTEEQQIISNWCNYSPLIVQQQQSKIKDKNKVDMGNTNKVLLQMNQFIEDWLRPATLQGEKYDIWYTNKAKNMDDNATNENVKNVWQKDIQNIWQIKDDAQPQMEIGIQMDTKDVKLQQEENIVKGKRGIAVADTWKPLDLLLQLNAADASPEQIRDRDDAFLSKLSWEHENLAAIWNNSTPLPTVNNVDENENNIINDLEIKNKKELNEKEITSNYDNESQPSDRVKAFLKHLGVLDKKTEKSAVTVTAHNTPKLTIVMATATGNRKRRHSESLNLLELMVDGSLNPKDKMDLEKLKDILGIDGICCKKTTKIVDTNLANDYGNDKNINENGNDGNDVDNLVVAGEYGFDVHKQQQKQQQQQQTIITCKYWATAAAAAAAVSAGNNNDNNKKNNMKRYENIDSIIDIDINDELIRSFTMDPKNFDGKAGAQFSCQFDKNNASILRHVTTAMITRPLTR